MYLNTVKDMEGRRNRIDQRQRYIHTYILFGFTVKDMEIVREREIWAQKETVSKKEIHNPEQLLNHIVLNTEKYIVLNKDTYIYIYTVLSTEDKGIRF